MKNIFMPKVKSWLPHIVMIIIGLAIFSAIRWDRIQRIYFFNKLLTSLEPYLISLLISVLCSIIPLIFERAPHQGEEKPEKAKAGSLIAIFVEGVVLGFIIYTTIGSQYAPLPMTDPDSNTTAEYFGNVAGDAAAGQGRLFDTQGNLIYQGGFKENLYDGYGIRYERINSVLDSEISGTYQIAYVGFYKNGAPHGQGEEYRYNGDYSFGKNGENPYLHYQGEYVEGKYCGQGTLYERTEKYEGGFFDGRYNGYGSLLIKNAGDGQIYKRVGMFIDGSLNGEGKIYYQNGNPYYEGGLKNNAPHGKGTLYREDGEIWVQGEWKDDKLDGYEMMFYESGAELYAGNYSDNRYHGQGTIYWENGSIYYTGSFVNGERSGEGRLYRENGTLVYEGQWANDVYSGQGREYDENENLIYEGIFEDGRAASPR